MKSDPPAPLETSSELESLRDAIRAARAELPEAERMRGLELAMAAKLAALGAGLGGGGPHGGGAGAGGAGGGGAGPSGAGGAGAAKAAGAGLGAAKAASVGGTVLSAGGGAAAAGTPFAVKALGAAIVAAGAISSTWYGAQKMSSRPSEPVVTVTQAAPAVSAPPSKPAEPPAPSAPIEESPVKPVEVAPVAPKPAPRASSMPAEGEIDLLHDAQDALARDPKRALSLCEAHNRRFPSGTFAQEREVIAIDALLRLGRRDEAEARADRFSKAYPTSAHRSRIDSLLAQP